MRPQLERLLAPALLLVASCADDGRAAEIACQQRVVDIPNLKMNKAGPGESVVASSFAQLSQRYAEMPLDGCTDGQAYTAKSLSRLARELADTAGVAEQALEDPSSVRNSRAFMTFTANLEQFENRRRVAREQLTEMRGGKR